MFVNKLLCPRNLGLRRVIKIDSKTVKNLKV